MISIDEITGIVSVMGAVTFEELYKITKEIIEFRTTSDSSYADYLSQLCSKAIEMHLLEYVDADDVSDESNNCKYYIVGPNAFPDIPTELSEVIDILQIAPRNVDMNSIERKLQKKIKYKITLLKKEIRKTEKPNIEDIKKIEKKYGELLNLYYDYDSWRQNKFKNIAQQLAEISKDIEVLKNKY